MRTTADLIAATVAYAYRFKECATFANAAGRLMGGPIQPVRSKQIILLSQRLIKQLGQAFDLFEV
jgi:hypothetical protein